VDVCRGLGLRGGFVAGEGEDPDSEDGEEGCDRTDGRFVLLSVDSVGKVVEEDVEGEEYRHGVGG